MTEIVFVVEEDPVDGGYVARALGQGITTQAETVSELKAMVLDAVRCHFDRPEDRPKAIRLLFSREEVIAPLEMKLPRDIPAARLIQALRRFGYEPTRQTGSHIRLGTAQDGEYHETIPNQNPLKAGTLNSILRNIAAHHGLTREQLLERLDL